MSILLGAMLTISLLNTENEQKDDAKDLDRLQGSWSVVSMVSGGEPLPKEIYASVKVSINGNKVEVKGVQDKPVESTLNLDAGKQPKEFTLSGPFHNYVSLF